MRRTLAVALAAAALALTGCSAISTGTITGKEYTPGHYDTTVVCVSYGKYGCRLYVPDEYYVAPEYRLDLEQGGKTGWVDVPEHTYQAAKVGSYYGSHP